MSASAWLSKLAILPSALCRCGHEAGVHSHGKDCTAVVDESRMRYCRCEVFRLVPGTENSEGEEEMAKKKETKKRSPSARGERLYEAFSSKIEAHAIGKKVADRENKQHAPLVARVLLSFDKPVGIDRIVTAAKNSGYDAKNAEHYIKGDLAFLVREGLAKATLVESKPNGSPAKPKRARRASKKGTQPGVQSGAGAASAEATA